MTEYFCTITSPPLLQQQNWDKINTNVRWPFQGTWHHGEVHTPPKNERMFRDHSKSKPDRLPTIRGGYLSELVTTSKFLVFKRKKEGQFWTRKFTPPHSSFTFWDPAWVSFSVHLMDKVKAWGFNDCPTLCINLNVQASQSNTNSGMTRVSSHVPWTKINHGPKTPNSMFPPKDSCKQTGKSGVYMIFLPMIAATCNVYQII